MEAGWILLTRTWPPLATWHGHSIQRILVSRFALTSACSDVRCLHLEHLTLFRCKSSGLCARHIVAHALITNIINHLPMRRWHSFRTVQN